MRFRFPWSLPYVFVGLKVAISLAVIGAVVGEFVGATKGLGYVIVASGQNANTTLAFAAIVLLSLMSIVLFYAIVGRSSASLVPWAEEKHGDGDRLRASRMSSTRAGRRLHALDGIDLEIRESEFVTLVGRSGCGKSTLLRIIAGLLRPTAGEVASAASRYGAASRRRR